MNKVRFRYSKTGKSKYISHLDLTAAMQRAFLRAGIKLKYSEGFNPHPYMSVALPLSVGCESICELIDVGLYEETVPDIKLLKLPEGIVILDAYKPARKFNEIKWVSISGNLYYEKPINDGIIEKLRQYFNVGSFIISKRTKRGNKELDIIPYIKDLEFHNDGNVVLKAKISAQEPTINAEDIINALHDEHKPNHTDIKRLELYDSKMQIFK